MYIYIYIYIFMYICIMYIYKSKSSRHALSFDVNVTHVTRGPHACVSYR